MIEKYHQDHQLEGQTLPPKVKLFRFEVCEALFLSNTAMESADPIISLLEEKAGLKIGSVGQLDNYGDMIFENEHDKLFALMDRCFPEYSVTGDGTPNFAEWEGLTIRKVTFDWKIVEPLVRIAALKKGPNAEILVLSFEDTIGRRMRQRMTDLRAMMLDRAATNTKWYGW